MIHLFWLPTDLTPDNKSPVTRIVIHPVQSAPPISYHFMAVDATVVVLYLCIMFCVTVILKPRCFLFPDIDHVRRGEERPTWRVRLLECRQPSALVRPPPSHPLQQAPSSHPVSIRLTPAPHGIEERRLPQVWSQKWLWDLTVHKGTWWVILYVDRSPADTWRPGEVTRPVGRRVTPQFHHSVETPRLTSHVLA